MKKNKNKNKQQDIVKNSVKTLEMVHIQKKKTSGKKMIFFSEFHIIESQHHKVFLTWV